MRKSGGIECLAWTWGVALLFGVLVAAALWAVAGWTFMQGAFMGFLGLLILGAVLTISMCREAAPMVRAGSAGNAGTAKASTAPAAAAPKAAPPAAATAAPMGLEEAAQEPEEEILPVDAAPQVVAEAETEVTPGDDPAPEDDASPEPNAPEILEPASAPQPDPEVTETPAGEGSRPEALDGPRGGSADDLKRIKGVGPKMEQLLNRLGFYHFDQVASWSADEVAWVDQNLEGFKGRVSRDNWVDQARLLAAGGETEFSKKVDDGDVY